MYTQIYPKHTQSQQPKSVKTPRSTPFLDQFNYTKAFNVIGKCIIGLYNQNKKWCLKIQTICQMTGYSYITVRRALKQFEQDLWLYRSRDNRYCPYNLDVIEPLKKALGYKVRINSLSDLQEGVYLSTGKILSNISIEKLHKENERHTRTSNSIKYNSLKNPLLSPLKFSKMGLSQKENEIRTRKVMGIRALHQLKQCDEGICESQKRMKECMCLLTKEQKERLLSKKDAQGIHDLLLDARVWGRIITPFNNKVCELAGITKLPDRMKLVPYQEKVLQEVFHDLQRIHDLSQSTDPVGLVVSLCKKYSTKFSEEPDFSFYFQVCSIIGIPTELPVKIPQETKSTPVKPSHNPVYEPNDEETYEEPTWPKNNFKSKSNANVQAVSVRSLYPVYEGNSKRQTVSERQSFLEKEITKLQSILPTAPNNPFLSIMIPKFELDLQNYQAELKQLQETLS